MSQELLQCLWEAPSSASTGAFLRVTSLLASLSFSASAHHRLSLKTTARRRRRGNERLRQMEAPSFIVLLLLRIPEQGGCGLLSL